MCPNKRFQKIFLFFFFNNDLNVLSYISRALEHSISSF